LKILAFDTATELCSAALWLDGEILSRSEMAGNRHSELLLPMITDLLQQAGLVLGQLDGIAFGKGPGSFTGLRIGCGVAQGLALGAELPVVGVVTLESLAISAGVDKALVCLDARMNEVYSAAYVRQGDGLVCLLPPGVYKPDQIPLPDDGGWLGCGSGFASYRDSLTSRCGHRLAGMQPDIHPHASAVARLAAPMFQAGLGQPADRAEPLYVRDKVALKTCER